MAASVRKGDASPFAEKPTDGSTKSSIADLNPNKVDGPETNAAKNVAVVPESLSRGINASSTLPVLEQASERVSNVAGNALQSAKIAGEQMVSRPEQKTACLIPAGLASNVLKTVPSNAFQTEPVDSPKVTGQGSTPALGASAETEGLVAGPVISEQIKNASNLSSEVPLSASETQPAKGETGRSVAVAGNIPLHRELGSIQTFAPGQIAKSAASSTSIKTVCP